MKIDTAYFPGWTRKSVTFTIDDGNVKYDRIFLDIVKPNGILGTFNLCSNLMKSMTNEEYVQFYSGYEISNHMKYHPTALVDSERVIINRDPFDPMTSPEGGEGEVVLITTETEGLYKFRRYKSQPRPQGWGIKADNEGYKRFIDEGKAELEEVFGKGSIKGFVWPCAEQNQNEEILNYVRSLDEYYGVRKTGATLDTTGFDMPADRRAWSYNATCNNILSLMETYESYPDDGKLKFFSFGVHSADFEREGKWDDLKAFAEKYGNRPEDYYYASVGDIFAYEDAVKSLVITADEITNPSSVTVYMTVNERRLLLHPNTTLKISTLDL